MNVRERIARLREEMKNQGIDLYFVPTNDFHNSEYICDYFKTREYLSGFDGSAGNMLITQEEAGLWTDGRYFIQAEWQLRGTGITLYKSGMEGVPPINDYIREKLPEGGVLGTDGGMVSAAWAEGMGRMLAEKGGSLELSSDLAGRVWQHRPELVFHKAWILPEEYAGESRRNKLERVRKWLEERNGQQMLLTSLDDIAWLLNIRGEDIPCNPVVLSYLVIEQEYCTLFAGEGIFSSEDREALERDGVSFASYDEIYSFVRNYPQKVNIFVDKRAANARIVENFSSNCQIVDMLCPIALWKSIKNAGEIAGERKVHIRDGVAVTKLIYWLKRNVDKMTLTEISVAEKLEEFRKQGENYLGPSFDTIAGYGEHGAIVHYSATPETDARLRPEGFLLVDSGGQYLGGTTDVTRTILLGGEATRDQKKHYTAVLRGNLNLCAAKFLYGCSGVALDYAARQPLWDLGLDYNHGTGHGVGCLLNVHEGPNAFGYKIANGPGKNPVLEAGMITSDEPGLYLEGAYGIRLENLILCVEREKNEFGRFMGFEPLTFVPFERAAIDVEQMSRREIELLNEYHGKVYDALKDYLEPEERAWLADECREM